MEHLTFDYPARRAVTYRAHVGVVGSGDLEVLLSPADSGGGNQSAQFAHGGHGADGADGADGAQDAQATSGHNSAHDTSGTTGTHGAAGSRGLSAHVVVRTSVDGYSHIWKSVLDRFFTRYDGAARIEINDFGATPGVVALRLAEAVEAAEEGDAA